MIITTITATIMIIIIIIKNTQKAFITNRILITTNGSPSWTKISSLSFKKMEILDWKINITLNKSFLHIKLNNLLINNKILWVFQFEDINVLIIHGTQYMPPFPRLAFSFNHFFPMSFFIFTCVISTHWEPANDLLPPHFLDVDHGKQEAYTRKFKFNNLEHKVLVVLWVTHASAYWCFALRELLSNGIKHRHFHIRIWKIVTTVESFCYSG